MYHYFPILKVENWCLVASHDSQLDRLSVLIPSDEASVHQISDIYFMLIISSEKTF